MSIITLMITGVIQAFLPEAVRQMRINESDQPFDHPHIDALDLRDSRIKAAARPRFRPMPSSTLYMGGRYFERSAA
jgi:hypothetical protein